MRLFGLTVAAAIASFATAFGVDTASAATCGEAGSGNFTEVGTVISEGVCYTAYTDSVYSDWSVAQAFAQSLTAGGSAGNLATFVDMAQYNAIAGLLQSLPADFGSTGTDFTGAWIGLRTTVNNGYIAATVANFAWVDGNSSTYAQTTDVLWAGGGPQTALDNYDYSGCDTTGSCKDVFTLIGGGGGLSMLGAYANEQPSLMIGAIVESIAPTPIPDTISLFAGGLAAMGFLGLRRKRKATVLAA